MTCGIYKIENNINHLVYIGQSINIEKRWQKHRQAKTEMAIHKAIRKYGIENFTFSILEECSSNELNEKEKCWISYYNSYKNGYNSTMGGEGSLGKGEKLTLKEVEIIRQLLLTSQKTNIELAQEFNVSENIISGINTGYYWKDTKINYPIRKQLVKKQKQKQQKLVLEKKNFEKNKYYCSVCGKEIVTNSKMCTECSYKARRKVERPSKEQLFKELQEVEGNFTLMGKRYSVSDNTIRKWCQVYGLPYHSKDYKLKKNT